MKLHLKLENCYLAGLVVQNIWSLPMTIQESIPVRCVLPAFVVLEWYGLGGECGPEGGTKQGSMVLMRGTALGGGTSPHTVPGQNNDCYDLNPYICV